MNAPRTAALAAAILLLGAGCAGRPIPPSPADPRAFGAEPWRSPLQREHPLVGYALSTRDGRWVAASEIAAALATADFVALGEIHDNEDHHRLQAAFLRAALAGGRRPALAFEMLDTGQAEALAALRSAPPVTPEAIEEATGWKKSGWPDFATYRPIFEVGIEAGLELVAANLPRSVAREVVRKGTAALPGEVREAMERAGTPTQAELDTWAREMEENHCQEVDPEILPGLVRAQRARDAQMAIRVAEAGGGGRGAVLITGGGHARTDRGVPAWLSRLAPGARTLSIGLVEADGELRWPRHYAERFGDVAFPFDYVVFTPRAEREDPCEELRRRNRERKKGVEATTKPQPSEPPKPEPAKP
jgi:uncharacterized iron-regulated protein